MCEATLSRMMQACRGVGWCRWGVVLTAVVIAVAQVACALLGLSPRP